ncbi:MAG: amidoligase family protein [Paludibacteraceae bacterium]|nr:amidoligase family protein [Paludibacteraceae bacterium]
MENEEELFVSEYSGDKFPIDERVFVKVGYDKFERWSRSECNKYARVCSDCGEYVAASYSTYIDSNDTWVCDQCRDNGGYVRCVECDDWLHPNDAYWYDDNAYCSCCYDELNRDGGGLIKDYHYHKGTWRKYFAASEVEHTHTFGFELETQRCDNVNDTAYETDAWSQKHGNVLVMEHDGSLDDGVEIISNPMSYRYWAQIEEDFKRLLDNLADVGTRAWDGGCETGFHIHLSRSFFKNKQHLGAFMAFIAMNYARIEELAGRCANSYCYGPWDWSYSRRQIIDRLKREGALMRPMLFEQLANADQDQRYDSINLYNDNTVELRMFRASLKYDRLNSYIRFALQAVAFAEHIMHGDVEPTWSNFLEYSNTVVCAQV